MCSCAFEEVEWRTVLLDVSNAIPVLITLTLYDVCSK